MTVKQFLPSRGQTPMARDYYSLKVELNYFNSQFISQSDGIIKQIPEPLSEFLLLTLLFRSALATAPKTLLTE